MDTNNCIFCKIINGEIPSTKVYEDDSFLAFLDISPATKGHVLLIPKKHNCDLFDIEEDTAAKALFIASKIAKAMKSALGCDGIHLLQNSGEAAGQTVFHFHMHLIPRYVSDSVHIPWKEESYADGEAALIAEKIKSFL